MILDFLDDGAALMRLFVKNDGFKIELYQKPRNGLARFAVVVVHDENLAAPRACSRCWCPRLRLR